MSQITPIKRITLADLRIVFEIIFHDTCTERKGGVNAEYAEFYDDPRSSASHIEVEINYVNRCDCFFTLALNSHAHRTGRTGYMPLPSDNHRGQQNKNCIRPRMPFEVL